MDAGFTKAKSAANYLFWLRTLKPTIGEKESKDGQDEKDSSLGDNGESSSPAELKLNHVDFAYPMRPNRPILKDLSVNVSRFNSSFTKP